ncbi:MAG: helix-hairpin-helix domain-containing protein, partial [Phycisphaerales bacterium]|nr:helix-hairpin-helix domain-containing protein [Phycisphaerales bacterium]
MKNLELAKLFERTADALALLEDNVFKISAYHKIARILEDMPDDIATADLDHIPGIGKSSAEHIREYLRTGQISEFEDIFSQIPTGVLQMLKIPTLGPKTAATLWHEAGITTIEQLKTAIEAGTLTDLLGLGEKKLQKIKQNLTHLETNAGRIRLGQAFAIANEIVEFLKTLSGITNAQHAGSLRRGKETIGDIDIVIQTPPQKKSPGTAVPGLTTAALIANAIRQANFCHTLLESGPTKISFRTLTATQVDIRIVPQNSFGAALQYFTGSQAHNIKLRELATKKGYKLNEYGLFKNEKQIAGKTEEEIYTALNLPFIPPELREDRGE